MYPTTGIVPSPIPVTGMNSRLSMPKKIPIAEGYVIQAKIKKKGKFKVIKVIRSGSTVKFRYSTKKNKYYRIRAYYTKNGKRHYFSYSGTVYAKVRK